MPAPARSGAQSLLWLLLGAWIGTWLLFGAVIAPTAFRVLPSSELGGRLVGPVLAVLHLFGGLAGFGLAALGWRLERPRWLVLLPLALGAVCLASHFGISSELARLRPLAFGPAGELAAAERFNRLHRLSTQLFVGVGLAQIALSILHGRFELLQKSSNIS